MSASILSVSEEADTIRRAVDGVGLLLDAARQLSPNGTLDARAVDAGVAVLSLVGARLRLVSSAMRGLVDPALCIEPFNAVARERIDADLPDLRMQARPTK